MWRSSSALALKKLANTTAARPVAWIPSRLFHAQKNTCMAKILCCDPIHPACIDVLRKAKHKVICTSIDPETTPLRGLVADVDAIVVGDQVAIDKVALQAASKLSLIAHSGTCVDNIDLNQATKQGILVMHPHFAEDKMAAIEQTMRQLISLATVRSPSSNKVRHSNLHDKTIGIIGLGHIGQQVALRCQALGMNVIGYDLLLSNKLASANQIEPVSLTELLARSDYISLHIPLNLCSRHFFNAARLNLCKDGVMIINNAQPALMDLNALLEALQGRIVAGAAIHPLPNHYEEERDAWRALSSDPRVFVFSQSSNLDLSKATKFAQQINDTLSQRSLHNIINAPNIDHHSQKEQQPYFLLAYKLGNMLPQLLKEQRLKRIIVLIEGRDVTSPELSTQITASVIQGLLSFTHDQTVTPNSARSMAEALGIDLIEHKHEEPISSNYSNRLSVAFEDERGYVRKITGTVFGKNELRLIALDDLDVDAIPSGTILIFQNVDQPGVLHSITSILARHEINIGCFSVAREKEEEAQALGILNVDEPVPEEAMAELLALDQLSDISQISLLDLPRTGALFRAQTDGTLYSSRHAKPVLRPSNPNFGSGPCRKRPGYALDKLSTAALGRSHRSVLGKGLIQEAITRSKQILKLPQEYHLGIVPASDTGAFEMAMWNMLGERPVDICYWESFGKQWYTDAVQELQLDDVTELSAPFGCLPNLKNTKPNHDIVFTWNGTTSGVCVPNGDWIHDDREGLTFNDATSAAFAMDIPWPKIDVCTFSWQKVLGGEGGHGVLILSPRAVHRLQTYRPKRPLPKIFRLTNRGKLSKGIFEGSTINTPSMLCIEDYLDALRWAERTGGLDALIEISKRNLRVVEDFCEEHSSWLEFLCQDKASRSNTSVCLTIKGFSAKQVSDMLSLLEKERVAFDIASYRNAPPGIRIWCGATVETEDICALMPWIHYAYLETLAQSDA